MRVNQAMRKSPWIEESFENKHLKLLNKIALVSMTETSDFVAVIILINRFDNNDMVCRRTHGHDPENPRIRNKSRWMGESTDNKIQISSDNPLQTY